MKSRTKEGRVHWSKSGCFKVYHMTRSGTTEESQIERGDNLSRGKVGKRWIRSCWWMGGKVLWMTECVKCRGHRKEGKGAVGRPSPALGSQQRGKVGRTGVLGSEGWGCRDYWKSVTEVEGKHSKTLRRGKDRLRGKRKIDWGNREPDS